MLVRSAKRGRMPQGDGVHPLCGLPKSSLQTRRRIAPDACLVQSVAQSGRARQPTRWPRLIAITEGVHGIRSGSTVDLEADQPACPWRGQCEYARGCGWVVCRIRIQEFEIVALAVASEKPGCRLLRVSFRKEVVNVKRGVRVMEEKSKAEVCFEAMVSSSRQWST
ncbi:hypothetical protein BJ546DRAFT_407242 [Cryomyces antarcticus]